MKVAIIAPPFVEVPPKKYGGTERRIESLGKHLVSKGIETTLYASGDSSTEIPLKPICDIALFNDPTYNHSTDREKRISEINQITKGLIDRFTDIVHSHGYDNLEEVSILSETGLPIVVSIAHAQTSLIEKVYNRFKNHPDIYFHGLSRNQLQSIDPNLPNIPNGVDPELFEVLDDEKQNYFFSIGDMKPIKGHKTAIRLAKEIGIDLVIAGAPYYPESKSYFEQIVRPYIDIDVSKRQQEFIDVLKNKVYNFGNGNIIYFGSASDANKKILFSNARFMQFLGNLEVPGNIEAYSLTCIESLLSGTPILGVKGSVTDEIIDEGETGISISSIEEAEEVVGKLEELLPKEIREKSISYHSSSAMADRYIKFYEQVLSSRNGQRC